jgi:hypothetical protein
VFNRDQGKWSVIGQALGDWGKIAQLVVILVVMAVCGFGPLIAIGWFLLGHGFSAAEVARVIDGWVSR